MNRSSSVDKDSLQVSGHFPKQYGGYVMAKLRSGHAIALKNFIESQLPAVAPMHTIMV